MITADVKIQRVEIEKFSLKEPSEFKIFFNDGNNKALVFISKLDNPEEEAGKIIEKIRNYEKELNSKGVDDDDFLDKFVNVRINDEEKVTAKISMFIAKIKDETKKLSGHGSVGYLDALNRVKSNKVEF